MEEELDDSLELTGVDVWPDEAEDQELDEDGEPFENRAMAYLRSELPAETAGLSDGQLQERILACGERAAAYGLTSEEQVIHFAATSYLLGEHFDSDPELTWTVDVLGDREMTADARAAMLVALAGTLAEERRG